VAVFGESGGDSLRAPEGEGLAEFLTQRLIPGVNVGAKWTAGEKETPEFLGRSPFPTESVEKIFDVFEINLPRERMAFYQVWGGIQSLPATDVEKGTLPGDPETRPNGGDTDCIEDLTHEEFEGLPLLTPRGG
jgi:hypothetical protein